MRSGRGFYVDGWGLFRFFRDFLMFGGLVSWLENMDGERAG